ncbi:MAG: cell division protein FtsA [Patescibacteria group bacterium]|nr:MAG: cell division protein FtsA [Patescibacteria group bacterium]
MLKNIVVGMDIGTYSIRVVVSSYVKGAAAPTIMGTSISPSRGLKHGYIINGRDAIKSVRSAIKIAEQSSGVKIKSVFLSIGGISLESIISPGSIQISRADEEVTELDIQKAISASREGLRNMANRKIIDTIPIRFKLDGKEVLGKPERMKGGKLEVKTLFITCLEQHINDLVHAVEGAGVEVEDIIASPIAASLVALSKRQRTVGCLLANIGAETVSISVFEDDIPISLQVFPIGSTDITNDIALGLRIPLEEAEKIKVEGTGGAYPKRKLDEIIEARLSDIFELIEAHLKKIGRSGLLPAGIIITGGGAGISTIKDFAKASLKLPTKIATSVFLSQNTKHARDSSWFVAYGLCIFGFEQSREAKGVQAMRNVGKHIISWIKQILP